jgi:hypothetical protein
MTEIAHQRGDDGQFPRRQPDTMIVDRLTAFLNRDSEPSGADTVELIMQLIQASGRPLLTQPTTEIDAEVREDRYGLATALITADDTTIRIYQPTSGTTDLRIEVNTGDSDDLGVAITVNDRPVLDAMTCTTGSTVPTHLQLNNPPRRR